MTKRNDIVPDDDDADEQDQGGESLAEISAEDLRFVDDIIQALRRRFPKLVIDVDLR
jgi:hypothetical protein